MHWLFQTNSFYRIIFGSVRDNSLVELQNIMHWQSLMLYFEVFFTLALCVLFSYYKKWLSYISHAISPYLHEQMHLVWCFVVWFYREYWIYYYSLWIGLFQFVFVNYILFFFLRNFTLHGICIEQIYLIDLYFLVACVGHPKSVVTWYLGTLLGFRNS